MNEIGVTPKIGQNAVRFSKSYLGCCKCHLPVTVVDITTNGAPVYKCLNKGCSAFDKTRNRLQRDYHSYEIQDEFRKVGVVK